MAHPVIEGRVDVLKVVTPGSYWIKCANCRGTSRIPESIRRKKFSGDFYPSNGTKVFVHDEDGFFYHGTVCGRGSLPIFASMQARKYAVQLTHTFQVKEFDRCHIYPTFDQASVACESAHFVSLLNVLPRFPPPDFTLCSESDKSESCQSFEDSVQNWDDLNSIVEDLIKNHRNFRYQQLSIINGCFYGKISFFETAGYINIKDFLASQNIAVRVTFRFEAVVQSLMSRALYKCLNLEPVYNPYCVPNREVVSNTCHENVDNTDNNYYDLSEFRVLEEDLPLHESLWTPTSFNVLFTGLCKLNRVTKNGIRYVAPDGKIVLGTVCSPNVAEWVHCGIDEPEEDILKKYFQRQLYNSNPDRINHWLFEMNGNSLMPPSSDEEDDSSHSDDESSNLFGYDFEEALSKFKDQGGLIENYCSLLTVTDECNIALGLVQDSFHNLGANSLEAWQYVCLPSMVSKKNALIIGPESNRKMTSSIVSTLSLMRASSSRTQETSLNQSPSLVLFVHDCKRANQAARICQRISKLKVITSTYSQISETQKQEAQNGCDVLISTPSNWLMFTRDLKCFDCSRLSYVIFDSLEKLHKDYPADIEAISHDLMSMNKVQTIVLSNVWGSFLVDFVKSIENTTRCVIDLLQACFCYRLVPTVAIVSDEWDELLTSIILNDLTTLRLLLCRDYLEVATIKLRTNHLGSVLYADENEGRQSALESINRWKSNDKTFLVCSDLLFNELDFIQSANLLISWKQNTCSRLTLIQRMMSIRAHAPRERSKVPVYIFCSHDNLEELQFIKQVLENVQSPGFLGLDLENAIESAFKERENQKKGKHCSSVLMFGKCDLTPLCPYRHMFVPQDLIHVRNSVFLKVTLVKFHSAFHSTVRVEDVISNQEISDTAIHSFSTKLSEIEAGLQRAFKTHVRKSSKLRVDMKVDDVVGACFKEETENILRRVQIVSINERIDDSETVEYRVLPMDFDEPSQVVQPENLFPLPPKIVSFPRDIVDIFITKLAPTDPKSNWVFETKCVLNNFDELLANYNANGTHMQLIAGDIEAVIGRSILVNSMHWCSMEDSNMHVVASSTKKLILYSQYAKSNPEHFNDLSKLTVNCGTHPFIDINEEEFGYRRRLPTGFNSGLVTAFDDPGLFYIQLDAEKQQLKELEKHLTATLNTFRKKLVIVKEGEFCAIQVEGLWNRALIVEKKGTSIVNDSGSSTLVSILCVDYGDVQPDVDVHRLYCLPNEFIEGLPYFAVECELVGVSPFDGQWCENAVEEFKDHVRNSYDQMKPVNVKFYGVVEENPLTKELRHQVALQDPDKPDLTINQLLVIRGMAGWNEATVDLLITRDKQPRRNTRRKVFLDKIV